MHLHAGVPVRRIITLGEGKAKHKNQAARILHLFSPSARRPALALLLRGACISGVDCRTRYLCGMPTESCWVTSSDFSFHSVGKELEKNIALFDAVEYSHFYLKRLNRLNKKAARFAHLHEKPLLGTSDAHHLWRINFTYTLIDSKKDVISVLDAIRKNKIELSSRPLSLWAYIKVIGWALPGIKRFIKK